MTDTRLSDIRGILYDPRLIPDADLGLAFVRTVLQDPALTHANLDARLIALDEFMAARLLRRLQDRFAPDRLLHRRLALMRILGM